MIAHYIILGSSYSKGCRIAIHYSGADEMQVKASILKCVDTIKDKCGDLSAVSTHYVETDSLEWKSVESKDSFFKDVEVINDINVFVQCINDEKQLRAMDVAKYIQSSISNCTHLKLEKLVYLCYADYLCDFKKKLFMDEIKAYKYGPVVDSVYNVYKGKKTLLRRKDLPAMRSRILFANDGAEKLSSIERTIEKYGKLSAHDLVDITHRRRSPWSQVRVHYAPITDELIMKYHSIEAI